MMDNHDCARIHEGLVLAGRMLREFQEKGFEVDHKEERGDPVTEADLAVDHALRELLPEAGEGWLSEETVDDAERLKCSRVWVVDPLDGTREFVQRIPEWCVSIGLVEDGVPIAGGIYNPLSEEMIIGARGAGVTLNGEAATIGDANRLSDALVLASRSEVNRGEWSHYEEDAFKLKATGSVAYKLGLVAGGLCQATWTLVPKSEWDVAAGVALVLAGGGEVFTPQNEMPIFNQAHPKLKGLIASGPRLAGPIRELLGLRQS